MIINKSLLAVQTILVEVFCELESCITDKVILYFVTDCDYVSTFGFVDDVRFQTKKVC